MSTTVIDLSTLDGSNGFRLDGEHFSDQSGRSVSGAGDVNGDGFDDVIVGAWAADPNAEMSGSSYVVFGKATGFDAQMDLSTLDGRNGFRLDGEHFFDQSGLSVSGAGDVNGDGFDDVIVGALGNDPNGEIPGSSVVFGRASGFDAQMDLSTLDGHNGFRLVSNSIFELSGYSVSGAGDINGDGFGDVIVGAWAAGDSNANESGSSHVVFGKASGFDAQMNLSRLGGRNGFRLDGEHGYDNSGWSVSDAGDVNGDGFDDLIIGAPLTDLNGVASGSSYVLFGKAKGFDAQLSLSSLNGRNGFRLDGEHERDYSGWSVSGAGDVNGDGFGDVIIGALATDSNGVVSGSSYVLFGKAKGFDAQINLSSLNGSNGFRLDGEHSFDYSGRSVSGAGDVNGDGFDDVIVGAKGADHNGNVSGSSYIVFGKATGFDAHMVSNLGSSDGFRLDGEHGDDFLGFSVSGAGDVNGDGLDDVIVGAYKADPNDDLSGSSYVIFGSRDFGSGGGGLPEIKGTDGDDTLKGNTEAEHFMAGGGNDSLLGRGGEDVFDAGSGDDAIRIGDLTFASIDGGDGNDALHLAGADLNLDLTTLGSNIHSIETICLYGRGDNTLTLNADSLLNLSDFTNTLKVHGNSGDHIAVQGTEWVDGGSYGFYHTYTHDDAVLLIGANVTVEFV